MWMKALFFENELRLIDYPKPERRDGEALIKVLMASICNTDLEIIKGYMGFNGILGHEFVGIVEECNNRDLLGKRVVGEINCSCGNCDYCVEGLKTHCENRSVLGILAQNGAFAEYLVLPEENLHVVPDRITDEEAVFVEPLAAAFQITQQTQIRPSDKVIILGDGKLGFLVAQVLALTGSDLLVTGKHLSKLSALKRKGVETRLIDDLGERKADVVIDCTGSSKGFETALRLTRSRGKIVLKSTVAEKIELDLTPLVINEITLIGSRCGPFDPAIRTLEKGFIDVRPFISEIFSLSNGLKAFSEASKRGALKILLRIN